MENKEYFIPDIEDFYVGVVYEKYSKGLQMDEFGRFLPEETRDNEVKWREGVIKYPSDILHVSIALNKETIRVSYLTKEQIEAEGWKHTGGKLLSFAEQHYVKSTYRVSYSIDSKKIKFFIADPDEIINYEDECIFNGQCKDINTFRKIIKLLGI